MVCVDVSWNDVSLPVSCISWSSMLV